MKRSRIGSTALVVAVVVSLVGCKGGIREDPILRLSADEAFQKGQELMEKKKLTQAVKYFDHAFEVAPNSRTGRDALLLAADSYYLSGGMSNYVKAEAKYRDFQNRFPTSDRSDYVQVQIANCLAEQIRKPDRDQAATYKALAAFEGVQQLFPTSEYASEVDDRIVEIRNHLAEHEYRVGRYNYRRRIYVSAVWRLDGIVENYPDFEELDKVLYLLGMTYHKTKQQEKAEETFDRLRTGYPDSKFVQKIPKEKIKS